MYKSVPSGTLPRQCYEFGETVGVTVREETAIRVVGAGYNTSCYTTSDVNLSITWDFPIIIVLVLCSNYYLNIQLIMYCSPGI